MICRGDYIDADELILHALPNGGVAVLDRHDKMVVYNKNGPPEGNEWDWVRRDCQPKKN